MSKIQKNNRVGLYFAMIVGSFGFMSLGKVAHAANTYVEVQQAKQSAQQQETQAKFLKSSMSGNYTLQSNQSYLANALIYCAELPNPIPGNAPQVDSIVADFNQALTTVGNAITAANAKITAGDDLMNSGVASWEAGAYDNAVNQYNMAACSYADAASALNDVRDLQTDMFTTPSRIIAACTGGNPAPSPSPTPSQSNSPSPTPTPSQSNSPSPTPTSSQSSSPTPTSYPSPSPTP